MLFSSSILCFLVLIAILFRLHKDKTEFIAHRRSIFPFLVVLKGGIVVEKIRNRILKPFNVNFVLCKNVLEYNNANERQ